MKDAAATASTEGAPPSHSQSSAKLNRSSSSLNRSSTPLNRSCSSLNRSSASLNQPELDPIERLRSSLAKDRGRVLDLFRRWDCDGNGEIDKREFLQALRALGYAQPASTLDAMFDAFDNDGNGTIDYGELHAALRQKAMLSNRLMPGSRGEIVLKARNKIARRGGPSGVGLLGLAAAKHKGELAERLARALRAALSRVTLLFSEWDSDGDGIVTRAELGRALRSLGMIGGGPQSRAECEALFDSIDVDRSGTIELAELIDRVGRTSSAAKKPDDPGHLTVLPWRKHKQKVLRPGISTEGWHPFDDYDPPPPVARPVAAPATAEEAVYPRHLYPNGRPATAVPPLRHRPPPMRMKPSASLPALTGGGGGPLPSASAAQQADSPPPLVAKAMAEAEAQRPRVLTASDSASILQPSADPSAKPALVLHRAALMRNMHLYEAELQDPAGPASTLRRVGSAGALEKDLEWFRSSMSRLPEPKGAPGLRPRTAIEERLAPLRLGPGVRIMG